MILIALIFCFRLAHCNLNDSKLYKSPAIAATFEKIGAGFCPAMLNGWLAGANNSLHQYPAWTAGNNAAIRHSTMTLPVVVDDAEQPAGAALA